MCCWSTASITRWKSNNTNKSGAPQTNHCNQTGVLFCWIGPFYIHLQCWQCRTGLCFLASWYTSKSPLNKTHTECVLPKKYYLYILPKLEVSLDQMRWSNIAYSGPLRPLSVVQVVYACALFCMFLAADCWTSRRLEIEEEHHNVCILPFKHSSRPLLFLLEVLKGFLGGLLL